MSYNNFYDKWLEHEPKRETRHSQSAQPSADLANDVEIVTQRIEAKSEDITATYSDWVNLGFALTEEFGESGRDYYHRLSCFYPGYNETECDKQYDKCLRSHGTGITIKTFFQLAKDHGISLLTSEAKSPTSPISPKTPHGKSGDSGDLGDSGESSRLELPTFSDIIVPNLPTFLNTIAKYGGSVPETDGLLLSAIGILSGCLPNIYGIYGRATVFANLFFFISARAASGKGNLKYCRNLVQPIHKRERQKYEQLKEQYDKDIIAWECTAKSKRGDKPTKPKQTMLFIPANNSATSFYQLLHENDERAIIFEPEADALTNTFASDFGNYSDGFRRAFHHECIAYHRRGGDEDVEVAHPRLSVVLTGTPKQIISLIKDAENGLFSRFGYYRIDSPLQWEDVLGKKDEVGLDATFDALGQAFCQFYDNLIASPQIRFQVTDSQRQKFNAYFSSLQEEYYHAFNDDIIGSVRRLGLICFRIAMVLSALRMWDTGERPEELICNDEDFESAMTIVRVLAVHTAKVFEELSSTDFSKTTAIVKSAKRQRFFAALPNEFDRQGYVDVGKHTGVPESTAEKWISAFCSEDGPLERVEYGRYRKR